MTDNGTVIGTSSRYCQRVHERQKNRLLGNISLIFADATFYLVFGHQLKIYDKIPARLAFSTDSVSI